MDDFLNILFQNEGLASHTQRSYLLSDKIVKGMKNKKLSRKQFADKIGVQPCIITRWLKGKHNFTIETLFKIEQCLDIELVLL